MTMQESTPKAEVPETVIRIRPGVPWRNWQVQAYFDRQDQAQDAARLWDAASDLLVALQSLVAKFNEFDPDKTGYRGFSVAIAEEAIAKATGGQS